MNHEEEAALSFKDKVWDTYSDLHMFTVRFVLLQQVLVLG